MKNFLIVLFITCSFAFSQGTQLKLYDYLLQANANVKTKSGKIGFITLKPVKNAKDETTFGFWLSNNTNSNAVFLEIKDGQKTIATVSSKDFSAKAKIQTTGTKSTAVYKTGTGVNAIDIAVESDVVSDETMPLAKSVEIAVKVKTSGNKNLNAILTVFGDGFVNKVGTNGVSTSRTEKGKADFPLVTLVGNPGTSVSIDNAEQKTPGKLAKISSSSVVSSGLEVSLLSFRVNGTTVRNYEKSVNQASNIETIISAKKEVTELSLINSASNTNPFPGDTVTYTISYHNIGNSFAQDAVVSNDVPEGMAFVENSATGENAEISFERKEAVAPQLSEVKSISWKIKKKILPGEEGIVSFKAILR